MLHKEDENSSLDTCRPKVDVRVPRAIWLPYLLESAHSDSDGEPEWIRGLTKTQAEELLDWLEAHGVAGEVTYADGSGFAVRPAPR
jgi:hypothetical protein